VPTVAETGSITRRRARRPSVRADATRTRGSAEKTGSSLSGRVCSVLRVVVVGLTGGIGAGKSSVSSLLVERGAVLIDADAVVRELQAPGGAAIAPTIERFGPDIVDVSGAIDRPKLAAIVFADEAARRDNNAIVHPLVGAAIAERLAALGGADDIAVLDVPLLVEGRGYDLVAVIVVDCPLDIATDRLVRLRGMDPDDVARRIDAQATREERLARADFVIDNSGSPEDLAAAVDVCWDWLAALHHHGAAAPK